MSNYYSDPTANAAIGSIDREFARMKKKAERYVQRRFAGTVTPEYEEYILRQFRGIFQNLPRIAMREALDKLDEEQNSSDINV